MNGQSSDTITRLSQRSARAFVLSITASVQRLRPTLSQGKTAPLVHLSASVGCCRLQTADCSSVYHSTVHCNCSAFASYSCADRSRHVVLHVVCCTNVGLHIVVLLLTILTFVSADRFSAVCSRRNNFCSWYVIVACTSAALHSRVQHSTEVATMATTLDLATRLVE